MDQMSSALELNASTTTDGKFDPLCVFIGQGAARLGVGLQQKRRTLNLAPDRRFFMVIEPTPFNNGREYFGIRY